MSLVHLAFGAPTLNQQVTVLRTRITPPRLGARLIERPRLTRLLGESLHYRLTLVQAGAGFGKTTALAALAGSPPPLIWYQLMDEDRNPLVFLLHLCHAARLALPDLSDLPISLLESWDGTSSPLPSTQILDEWLNSLAAVLRGPVLLVLDDVIWSRRSAKSSNSSTGWLAWPPTTCTFSWPGALPSACPACRAGRPAALSTPSTARRWPLPATRSPPCLPTPTATS